MAEPGPLHLSIGEVLGLLLEEFPDVTISKIRFLESQGLIEPERTPSGYRKFFEDDVELLRVILREQRENFLPLRVIKDRIDSGQLDPTPPRGSAAQADDDAELAKEVASHPSTGRPAPTKMPAGAAWAALGDPSESTARPSPTSTHPSAPDPSNRPLPPSVLPGVLLTRDELAAMAGVTAAELGQLEEYSVVAKRPGVGELYGDDAVEIAAAAAELLRAGVDARHLRGWRHSVDREASLFEQLVMPLIRHRNPQARGEVNERLRALDTHSARLRSAMMRAALARYFET